MTIYISIKKRKKTTETMVNAYNFTIGTVHQVGGSEVAVNQVTIVESCHCPTD